MTYEKPIHHPDCYTEIRKSLGHSYMELIWNCVDECKLGVIDEA